MILFKFCVVAVCVIQWSERCWFGSRCSGLVTRWRCWAGWEHSPSHSASSCTTKRERSIKNASTTARRRHRCRSPPVFMPGRIKTVRCTSCDVTSSLYVVAIRKCQISFHCGLSCQISFRASLFALLFVDASWLLIMRANFVLLRGCVCGRSKWYIC